MIRHRRSRSRSRSYNSVSPRRHSRFLSRSRGKKKKSHEKRKHSSTSSSSSRRSFSYFSRERERKRHKSKKKKKKHSKSRSSKCDKSEKKHKRKRSPTLSPSSTSSSVSSDFSSSLQRYRSLGIGHTGNPSDNEHSVHRIRSVRPDTVDHWSILLNCALIELRSELEHRSASLEPDIVLMFLVHHGGITAHIVQLFPFDMLTQVNTFRLHGSGIVVSEAVLALTTLSLRDFIVVPPLVQEGRRRSYIRRGNTSTSRSSYHRSSFSSFR